MLSEISSNQSTHHPPNLKWLNWHAMRCYGKSTADDYHHHTVLSDESTHYQPDDLLIRAPAGWSIQISGNPENSAVESRTSTRRMIILAVVVMVRGAAAVLLAAARRSRSRISRSIHPDLRISGFPEMRITVQYILLLAANKQIRMDRPAACCEYCIFSGNPENRKSGK